MCDQSSLPHNHPFDNAIWQRHLTAPFDNVIWQCPVSSSFDNAIWQCCLTLFNNAFNIAVWQHHLITLFDSAVWQHCKTTPLDNATWPQSQTHTLKICFLQSHTFSSLLAYFHVFFPSLRWWILKCNVSLQLYENQF